MTACGVWILACLRIGRHFVLPYRVGYTLKRSIVHVCEFPLLRPQLFLQSLVHSRQFHNLHVLVLE